MYGEIIKDFNTESEARTYNIHMRKNGYCSSMIGIRIKGVPSFYRVASYNRGTPYRYRKSKTYGLKHKRVYIMKKFEYKTIRKYIPYEELDVMGEDGKKFYYIFKREKRGQGNEENSY
jgi:hypothetical protein